MLSLPSTCTFSLFMAHEPELAICHCAMRSSTSEHQPRSRGIGCAVTTPTTATAKWRGEDGACGQSTPGDILVLLWATVAHL